MLSEMIGLTRARRHMTANPHTLGEPELHRMAGQTGEQPCLAQIDDDAGAVDQRPTKTTVQRVRERLVGIKTHTVEGLAPKGVGVERRRFVSG